MTEAEASARGRPDLRASIFERASFRGAVLRDADLRQASFRGCTFANANMTDAKLTRAMSWLFRLSRGQRALVDWQAPAYRQRAAEPWAGSAR